MPHVLTILACIFALTVGLHAEELAPIRDASMIAITLLAIRWWLSLTVSRRSTQIFVKKLRAASAIDMFVGLWAAAIAIAWLANNLLNRRTSIGAWYQTLALLTILVVVDLIRRGLPRRWLIDGLLFIGVFWMAAGLFESWNWLSNWLQTSGSGLPFLPMRPSAIFGDPNSFATALLALLFLSIVRITGPKRLIVRLGWVIYTAVALFLLILTQSRGGWVGAAGGTMIGLVLLFRFSKWRLSWHQIAVLLGVLLVAGIIAVIFVLVPLFRATERGDNRPEIYRIALQAFLQQPLTGHGPDSFGLQLFKNQSIPPEPAHLHAHESILNIAAELGIPGLVALVVSVLVGLRLYWRNLSQTAIGERAMFVGLGAACAAIAAHGLFDTTAVLPSLLLLDVGVFATAIAPGLWSSNSSQSSAVHDSSTTKRLEQGRAPRLAAMMLSLGLTLFIVIAGWVGTLTYDPYWSGLQAISNQPFPAGWVTAQPLLETAASIDPQSPVTSAVAGYVDGLLSAVNADPALRQKAIHYYEQSLAIETPNAINWLNLALLYRQDNRADEASHAAAQAIIYASKDPLFLINGGLILEQFDHTAEASAAYSSALKLEPDLIGQPIWQATALRQTIVQETAAEPTYTQQFLSLLEAGDIDAATKQVKSEFIVNWVFAQPYLNNVLLLIRTHGDLTLAQHYLIAAVMNANDFHDWPWFHYVQAELDAARGDQAGHDREMGYVAHDPRYGADGLSLYGGNGITAAYFVSGLTRSILPSVWFPAIPSDLLPLLPASITANIATPAALTSQ